MNGASTGEGMGNRFLAGIREVDALVVVVRAFHDDSVSGPDDPLDSLETLELELVLADVASLENQSEKRRKQSRIKRDPNLAAEADAIDAAMVELQAGVPLFRSKLGQEARDRLHNSFLLTDKPVLAVVNIGEDQLEEVDDLVRPVAEHLGGTGEAIGVCVQLEAEAAQLDAGERAELMEGLGLGQGVVPRVARALAPECAGVIHSDLQRGFIRAEVIHWDELIELGGWNEAKSAGRLRVEGKDYPVKDGDVLEIRFNV